MICSEKLKVEQRSHLLKNR